MSKRRNPELPPRDPEDLKKTKKVKIIPKMNYLFIIKKNHTKLISEGPKNSFDVQNLLSTEVITVKIAQKPTPTIFTYEEKTLRKFLENFFKTVPEVSGTMGDHKEKKDEQGNKIEMSNEEKKRLKEDLIFQLYNKKFTAKTIAETFQIKWESP